MQLSMTLPTMIEGFDRGLALEWCRRIDAGPYRSLAVGERINFPNTEQLTTLAFAAAVTERVRIVPTIVVLPAHPAAAVAKEMATLDVLSGGRVTVGVGVGGRDEDFRALEKPRRRLHQTLDEQVEAMRRVWAGQPPAEGDAPIGPAPMQDGGPPLLSGSLGPKAITRAARWADGVVGFTLSPDADDHQLAFDLVRGAWAEAGRPDPLVATSFWFALDDDGPGTLGAYARRYLEVFGDDTASVMASMATASDGDRVAAAFERLEAAGCDEVFLVPTTLDPAVCDEVEAIWPG